MMKSPEFLLGILSRSLIRAFGVEYTRYEGRYARSNRNTRDLWAYARSPTRIRAEWKRLCAALGEYARLSDAYMRPTNSTQKPNTQLHKKARQKNLPCAQNQSLSHINLLGVHVDM